MMKMTNDQALSLVRTADSKAAEYCQGLITASELSLSYYEGLPFGDEQEGRSQLISTDVQDVIEDDMPHIVNALLSSENIMKFQTRSVNPEAEKEAKKKTDYINWIIRKQPTSYMTLYGWFKDALIQKLSVVTYYVDDTVEVKERTIQNITPEEINEKTQALEADSQVTDHSITSAIDNEDGTFDNSTTIMTFAEGVTATAFIDVNEDELLDLFLSEFNSGEFGYITTTSYYGCIVNTGVELNITANFSSDVITTEPEEQFSKSGGAIYFAIWWLTLLLGWRRFR